MLERRGLPDYINSKASTNLLLRRPRSLATTDDNVPAALNSNNGCEAVMITVCMWMVHPRMDLWGVQACPQLAYHSSPGEYCSSHDKGTLHLSSQPYFDELDANELTSPLLCDACGFANTASATVPKPHGNCTKDFSRSNAPQTKIIPASKSGAAKGSCKKRRVLKCFLWQKKSLGVDIFDSQSLPILFPIITCGIINHLRAASPSEQMSAANG